MTFTYPPNLNYFDPANPPPPYSGATSFANPLTLSAAFEDELVEAVADIIATEARVFSNAGRAGLDFWTPNINPYKDPRWGRGSETPGEDAGRTSRYVAALLRGLEGNNTQVKGDGRRKIIATCKHFAAYDLERWKGVHRFSFDAIVGLQDLAEYYLPPFRQCARDSNVGSIMCSYNRVNGTPACANTYLMQTVLREHWNWTAHNQYVTSDCGAIDNFHLDHKWTRNATESAAKAYAAGTDTVCEYAGMTDVKGAFASGMLTEETIDRALRRLYEGLVRVGYFDTAANASSPFAPYRALTYEADVNTPRARALALQSALDGLVLKKNLAGTLPLTHLLPDTATNTTSTVALIGHWAGSPTAGGQQQLKMLGHYSGIPPLYIPPTQAATQLGLTYTYASGPVAQDITNPSTRDTWTEPALAAATNPNVSAVLYFGGTDLSISSEERDRESIALPSSQLELISTLCAAAAAATPKAKPCVIVQLGDMTDDTPLLANPNVSAILWAGYPGQAGGEAVMRALLGVDAAASPAGRLPVSVYPASYADAVPMTDMALRPSTSGSPGRTYRWFNNTVLPFGFGLHYANFTARFAFPSSAAPPAFSIDSLTSAAACSAVSHLDLCPFPIPIPLTVTSSSSSSNSTSDFSALLFLRTLNSTTTASDLGPNPLRTLVGYTRLRAITPGTTRNASVALTLGDLARVDAKGNTVLVPGDYALDLDMPVQATWEFELVGDAKVLVRWPQPQ